MTAKERLVEAVKRRLLNSNDVGLISDMSGTYVDHHQAAFAAVDALLAHPDLLLAVLAETGVLTKESRRHPNWHMEGWREVSTPTWDSRFVSPWVPSGDQT